MPASLTIPTTFTAVDKFSTVISSMTRNLGKFTNKAGTQFLRFNQKFNNFFKLGEIQKHLLEFASTAAIVGGIVSGIVFSGKSLMDYEDNVAKVHSILNHLTEEGFKPFQKQIDAVAKQMQFSAVEVASSFQKIAELNIDLAKTPESIGAVSKAAITLSRAAGIELTPATEALVGIMAQFKLEGKDADRVINTLAAGMKYGSATIQDQVDAYKNWGTVAKSANMTLEQSTALTQTLGKYQLKGEEAGTALRATVIRLQKAHLGYASGLFNVNDALAEANKHYNKLAKARDKDNYLIKLFGIRQITAGRILLQNTDLINSLTQKVTGSNQAFEQAAIRTDTVTGAWERLKAQYINYITSQDKVNIGLERLKKILRYIADHMDTIIDTVITMVKWFAIFKVTMFAVSSAIKLYNLYQAASIALGATATETMAAQTVVVGGFGTAIGGVTTELEAANFAAKGLIGTIAMIAIPAALSALVGKSVFDAYMHNRDFDSWHAADNKLNAMPDTSKESMSWRKYQDSYIQKHFGDGTEADPRLFLKWWDLKNHPVPQVGKNLSLSEDVSVLHPAGGKSDNLTRTPAQVHIFLHDPAGNVKDVKSTGNSNINIKITSTTGPQGKM